MTHGLRENRPVWVSIVNYYSAKEVVQMLVRLHQLIPRVGFVISDNSCNSSEFEELSAGIERWKSESRFKGILLLRQNESNLGFGAGHNQNVSHLGASANVLDADELLICNVDLDIPSDFSWAGHRKCVLSFDIWSATLISTDRRRVLFSAGRVGAITGDLVIDKAASEQKCSSSEFVPGTFMMMRVSTYRLLGGFDERFFMYAEDLDLCLRAKRLGLKLGVSSERIIHSVGSGMGGAYSDLYLYENTKNRLECLRLHSLGVWPLSIAYFYLKYGLIRAIQLFVLSPLTARRQLGAVVRAFNNEEK